MATPVRTPHRPLVVATPSGGDALGGARRGAAFILIAAVLVGSLGVALAATAVLADAWAIGLVVGSVVFAGALLAGTAWRKGFC
jgi:hypothetical protein